MFKKCILILAVSCMMYSCATQTESNPFLTEFQTPNGVPPFDKIKLEHYEPAFQKGMEEQNANIQAIIDNTEAPTFENVIVALDIFVTGHNHTGYPEEDDIRSGHQIACRIVIIDFFITRIIDAVEQRDRP